MSKVIAVIKRELREAVFPTLFFLAVFNVLAATKVLILDSYSIHTTNLVVATVGAITVAKAVLVMNQMSFANWFSDKPLLYGILWKTLILTALTTLFRFIEELIPFWIKHDGFWSSVVGVFAEISWTFFWATQIWLVIALILFNTVTTLDRHFGRGSIRKALLG